jgi:hypothetical protein
MSLLKKEQINYTRTGRVSLTKMKLFFRNYVEDATLGGRIKAQLAQKPGGDFSCLVALWRFRYIVRYSNLAKYRKIDHGRVTQQRMNRAIDIPHIMVTLGIGQGFVHPQGSLPFGEAMRTAQAMCQHMLQGLRQGWVTNGLDPLRNSMARCFGFGWATLLACKHVLNDDPVARLKHLIVQLLNRFEQHLIRRLMAQLDMA